MRTLKRRATLAAIVAVLVSGTALAFQGKATPATKPAETITNQPAKALSNPLVAAPKAGLEARKPMPKTPTVRKPARTLDMLIVKFGDPVVNSGSARNGELTLTESFKGFEAEIKELQERFDVTFRHAVPHNDAVLNDIYSRAEQNSGRMQPNLKSYMYVEGPVGNLQAVANALLRMPITETVKWYEDKRPTGGGLPITGACCMPDTSCQVLTPAACALAGGTYTDDFTDCDPQPCNAGPCCVPGDLGGAFACFEPLTEDDCNLFGGYFQGDGAVCDLGMGETICDDLTPECGEATAGSCFGIDGENGTPYCNNEVCCDLVCDQDPFCCDENDPEAHWDEWCASLANQICNISVADRCNTAFGGGCSDAHEGGGCNNRLCCETVCTFDPYCCDVQWDALCVELARENCSLPNPTMDFAPLQGYLTRAGYGAQVTDFPPELQPFLPFLDLGFVYNGFGGEGWHMYDPNNPHEGLHGIGQELVDVYNHDEYGEGVLTRGKTIKVAVIEWGYWGPEPYVDTNGNGERDSNESYSDVNGDGQYSIVHEDLDVILEPGQTMFLNPQIAENNHGTACLGIINAKDNDMGMVGIAPDAQAYFFPLTSLEEGPREFAAWVSALNTLGPGDVISASYGSGGGNLNTDPATWPLIRLASDLGITTCVAAGNSCINLDDEEDLGDSGGIVVGACSPGEPYFRLSFSNYFTGDLYDNTRGNKVHLKAWGGRVSTLGYGDLSAPDGDPYRSYTLDFGGTSAAAPQIAGLVACLQGLAKQFYGIPLNSTQIRQIMQTLPPDRLDYDDIRLFGGFGDALGTCLLDYDPSEGPNEIGVYPLAAGSFGSAASWLLNQSFAGFDQSPLVSDVIILTGDKIFGNKFSVKGFDGNHLVVESEHADRSGPDVPATLPPGVPPGAIDKATYFNVGQTTDVLAVGYSPVPNISALGIRVIYEVPPGMVSMGVVEAYDWFSNRWEFVGMDFNFGNDGGLVDTNHLVPSPFRMVRASDRMVLYRFWQSSFGFASPSIGGGGGRPVPFISRIDYMGLTIQEGFASPFPGPPHF